MKLAKLQPKDKVGIDTMLFIYLMEQKGALYHRASQVFAELENNKISLVCSTMVITELLQQPIRHGNLALVNEYQRILLVESSIEFISLTVPVATRAAEIAGRYKLKTPDAIHLASSLEVGAKAFITADKKIKSIQSLEVIYL